MSPISPTNALSEPLPVDFSLSSVLLNAPTMVKTELGTRLVKDRHLHSNSLLRLLIAFDVSLEILPKRRKLLVRDF